MLLSAVPSVYSKDGSDRGSFNNVMTGFCSSVLLTEPVLDHTPTSASPVIMVFILPTSPAELSP